MSESLRRSTRTSVPVTPFTIDNPPTLKRKRVEPVEKPVVVKSTVEPAVKNQREHLSQCFPPTMFSDRSLDNVLHHNVSLQKDLEEHREKGANITVKELLAKNFKHYRVRPSQTSERATEIVNRTLSENEVPRGAVFSGPPLISPTANFYRDREIRKEMRISYEVPRKEEKPPTLQAALESLVGDVEIKTEIKAEPDTDSGLDEFATKTLAEFTPPEQHALEPIAYPGNFLPWPVFWRTAPNYLQGEIYLYVGDVVYTPISDIMKAGQFLVPLNRPIPFVFNEKLVELTLQDLLVANGVNLTNCQHYRMLQGVLHRAGVHIRADYAERLHDDGKPRPPLVVRMESLPVVCKHPEMFMAALGKRIHGAVLVDNSGEKPQIPNQTFANTVYSEQLDFDSRRQILILLDADVSISQIAHRYQCSIRSVHETIGTRLLIERHQIDRYLLEEPEVLHSNYTTGATVGDVMRPRNKIRRTHYVDLNKLVWKHFKDCQAQGVQINGKHLKDQAMRYAKEMGLESFRGSEGWLDAFKRRHKIDLKTMTGFPVCYENDMLDEVEGECEMAPFTPQEDITSNFFSSLLPEPSSSTHLQNMLNSMMTPSLPSLPPIGASFPELEPSAPGPDTFYNVMKSCQIRVADKEVSLALDTIRTYILAHDPPAMNLLVPLQERLARTSSNIASSVLNDTPTASS